jgi:hypothetical protein
MTNFNLIGNKMRFKMGKSKRSDKEFTREQRLIRENNQLKQELKYLRKQITKLNIDQFEDFKITNCDLKDNENDIHDPEDLKKVWACKKCNRGWLEITVYSKLNQDFYYRKCNFCDNRTKGKKYSILVKGIFVNTQR